MSTERQGRMLLSHNFDISPDLVSALSRSAFAEVFRVYFSHHDALQTRLVNHSHWIVEILFSTPEFSPPQVGEACAQALADYRCSQQLSPALPEILVLGGLKTTPPTSAAPEALQPGEWGVDVVETHSGTAFLAAIGWETTIASKSADTVFKVERVELKAA